MRMNGAPIAAPAPWMQTLRIDLRELTRDDFNDLLRLDGDPRVMRFINRGKASTPEEIEAALGRAIAWRRNYHGIGVWYATRRDTGAFIGCFMLKYCPPSCDIEVGYRLRHQAWGQGFATEGATELVRYAFDDLGLDRIIGVTHPGNRASQRVLLKAGLVDRGWGRYYNRRLRLFAAERFARCA
jgi:RimJ/RimL family protein N-acetyltransferase